jgi:tetratricopeptide (TPR) repeat protein
MAKRAVRSSVDLRSLLSQGSLSLEPDAAAHTAPQWRSMAPRSALTPQRTADAVREVAEMDTHDARSSEPAVTNSVVAVWQAAYANSATQPLAASDAVTPARLPHPADAAEHSWLCDPNDPEAAAIDAFFAARAEADALDPLDQLADTVVASAPMGRGARRAMWAALSMFSVSSLAIGGFVAYHRLVMPVPVELGVAGDASGSAPDERMETSVSAASQPTGLAQPSAAARLSQSPTFDELLQVAQSFAAEGQDKRALEAYDRALVVRPRAAAALAGKAQAHLNLNERAAAKQFAALAVGADPRNGMGWIVLGAVEELLGASAAAQAAYRQCADQAQGAYVPECRKLLR